MTTFRNDDVSVTLRRFYKLHMHGTNGADILLDDRLKCATTLINIAS
jgi:hypothetical protein